jgi:hypothetical protein
MGGAAHYDVRVDALTRYELEQVRGQLANANGGADLVAHHDEPSSRR